MLKSIKTLMFTNIKVKLFNYKYKKLNNMKFIKEEEEERKNYLLQKDRKTIYTARFTGAVLIILIIAIIVSDSYLS